MPNKQTPGNVGLDKKKNTVFEEIPYHFLHESELDPDGKIQKVNTLFLTGKECVFKCLMCDLWKNTLDYPTPKGAIAKQIDYALSRLPEADTIKLYNSSNFFDSTAIPPTDYPEIIVRLENYKRVVVENHPKLCGQNCLNFASQLNGQMEVAMGLESIHPLVVSKLNKQMSLDDFRRAVGFLRNHHIDVRTFILLNPPYLTDKAENIYWATKAVEFAFHCGVNTCTLIPTRMGSHIMGQLQSLGHYQAPELNTLEEAFEACLGLNKGLVFVDTWDLEKIAGCSICLNKRKKRIEQMNLSQKLMPKTTCKCQ